MAEGEGLVVDLSLALETLETLKKELLEVNGTPIPERATGKSRTAVLAEITRDLSFCDHLAHRLSVEIMNEFYVARGRTELA